VHVSALPVGLHKDPFDRLIAAQCLRPEPHSCIHRCGLRPVRCESRLVRWRRPSAPLYGWGHHRNDATIPRNDRQNLPSGLIWGRRIVCWLCATGGGEGAGRVASGAAVGGFGDGGIPEHACRRFFIWGRRRRGQGRWIWPWATGRDFCRRSDGGEAGGGCADAHRGGGEELFVLLAGGSSCEHPAWNAPAEVAKVSPVEASRRYLQHLWTRGGRRFRRRRLRSSRWCSRCRRRLMRRRGVDAGGGAAGGVAGEFCAAGGAAGGSLCVAGGSGGNRGGNSSRLADTAAGLRCRRRDDRSHAHQRRRGERRADAPTIGRPATMCWWAG